MKNLLLTSLILLLGACQPSTDKANASQSEIEKNVVSKTSSVNAKKAGGDFSLLVDLPYDIIESDQACEKPIVIEFFAYQCPHCYKLQKYAEAWKQKNGDKVNFKTIPTHLGHQEFNSFLIVHQAAKHLGILDKATPKMFTRLHEQKKAFASQDDVIAFFTSLGVTEDKARSAIQDGPKIQADIDEGFKMLAKYKVAGVPTLLVNYRYQFDVTKAGGYDKVFEVVNETLKLPSNCSTK